MKKAKIKRALQANEMLEELRPKFKRDRVTKTAEFNKMIGSRYSYACRIAGVVDGDTVDVDIDLGLDQWAHYQRIRLVGIDTPESRTRDKLEKKYGQLASGTVMDYFEVAEKSGSPILLKTTKKGTGKYGRLLGDFYSAAHNVSLCQHLLDHHCAVVYNAENKALVKEQHLSNRELLNSYVIGQTHTVGEWSPYTNYCFALYHSHV